MAHLEIKKALELIPELLRATEEELGWLETSEPLILQRIATLAEPSSTHQATQRTKALLKGSLLLYLFALWESHLPKNFKDWMNDLERQEFEAFEHIRDSVAHAKVGQRANFKKKRQAFETFYPFAGVSWNPDTDTIDIADSFVVNEFFSFMMGMSVQLAARMQNNANQNQRRK